MFNQSGSMGGREKIQMGISHSQPAECEMDEVK